VVLWGGTMGYCIIIFASCIGALPLEASVGCMAKSKHAYRCNEEFGDCCNPFDYKQLQYVYCACPCNEYDARAKKGKCQNCWHYHVPPEQVLIQGTLRANEEPHHTTSTVKKCR
jgi:hypothetical protein